MYLEDFVETCEEKFQDVSVLEVGTFSSPHLARTAASFIVELIDRGFDVFDFIELIYYENSFYEQRVGFKMASNDEEIPF